MLPLSRSGGGAAVVKPIYISYALKTCWFSSVPVYNTMRQGTLPTLSPEGEREREKGKGKAYMLPYTGRGKGRKRIEKNVKGMRHLLTIRHWEVCRAENCQCVKIAAP